MTEAVEFTGRRVLQLDLADPLSPIERAETPGGPSFRAAYVLVRLHDQPLGIIDAAIPEAGLPPAAVLGLV